MLDLDRCETKCEPHIKLPPEINVGSAFTIDFFLKDKSKWNRSPVDITGSTEIVVVMLNADNSFLELKLSLSQVSIIDGPGGHFQSKATATQSGPLKPSGINANPAVTPSYSDIEAHITDSSGDVIIVLFPQSVNLIPRLFPTAP